MTGRANSVGTLPLVLVSALTTWVALWSWGGFVENNGIYLAPLLVGIALISFIGVFARYARFPVVVVVAAQLLGVLLFTNMAWGTAALPTGASITAATQSLADSVQALRSYAAPVPRSVLEAGPVLVLAGLALHLIIDFCAVTLGSVPIAGLPLLVIYSLPVSVLDRSVNWLIFIVIVTGFLMMLALQEGSRISRWGRQFGPSQTVLTAFGTRDARRHPVAIGATATALALFIPLLIPTLDLELFGSGGSGGSGDRAIRITNPMTDLRRDLVRDQDIPLVRMESPGDAPRYLRVSVLTTFTGQAWTPGDRDLLGTQTAEGSVPPPIGLTDRYPTTTRTWDVSVNDDLKSWWLPTPMYLSSIQAGPDWRYDSGILDFYTADQKRTTAGTTYSLDELIPEFDGQRLSEAGKAPRKVSTRYTNLPAIPDEVTEITTQVTRGYESDYEKVQALQRYFRGGQFEYSTDRVAGNGSDALVQFLQEKIGYCEQYSSAMAVMARILDIPARVAVGFYQADRISPGVYEFSSHDLHAWPEIYFDDAGWVKFEPTPSAHIGTVPGYTRDTVVPEGQDPDNPAPTASARPAAPTPSASAAPPPDQDADAAQKDEKTVSFVPYLFGAGGLLLLIGLLFLPRTVRRARSTHRWRTYPDPAEAAWAELRDVTADVHRSWPDGLSPRATGRELTYWFGAAAGTDPALLPRIGPETNPAAVAAMTALVEALERSRYSATPSPVAVSEIRAHLDTSVAALRGGVTTHVRWRADWLPASLLGNRNRRGPETADDHFANPLVH